MRHCQSNTSRPLKFFRIANGFTLLELVLVLLLIGLIAGLTTPFVVSTLDRIELQSAARKLNAALRFARSEAVTRKTALTFKADIDKGRYWLTRPGTSQTDHRQTLDQSVRLVDFSHEGEIIGEGTFAIEFYPQGSASGGAIRMESGVSEKPEIRYVITIDPVTGNTKIKQEKL